MHSLSALKYLIMKRSFPLVAFLLSLSSLSFSQIQRVSKSKPLQDSASAQMQSKPADKNGRKQMLKELDLSREQRGKLKDIMKGGKSQKATLDADTTLSAPARQQKNRELKKLQAEKIMGILNEEQKTKFKKLRASQKGTKTEEMDDEMEMQ